MAYNDIPAAGTKLQIMIGYTYTDIPGATEISWEGLKRAVRNPTHLLSPAVVKKPGMPDFGQIKCKVNYDPNNEVHIEIRDKLLESAAVASAALDEFKLIYADGFATPAEAEVVGFISDFSHASGEAEAGTFTADLTIEVSEITAFTAGS